MDNTTHDLITDLTNNVIAQINQEIRLGQILRDASENERTEIAYFLHDAFFMNRNRPGHAVVTMEKVEAYIAYHLRKAEWRAAWNHLEDELSEIEDMDHAIFDDDVTLHDIETKMDDLEAQFDKLLKDE
jgi:hypothetical protein